MHSYRRLQRLKILVLLVAVVIGVMAAMTGVRSLANNNGSADQNVSGASTGKIKPGHQSGLSKAHETSSALAPITAEPQAGKKAPKVEGCVVCHGNIEPMHQFATDENGDSVKLTKVKKDGTDGQDLTCTYCHGGNPAETQNKDLAHVQPRYPSAWKTNGKWTGALPENTNALLEKESYEFVRFINPGDFRAAGQTCGTSGCHGQEVHFARSSMMTHGAMLWGAALYNNGGFPIKDTRFGESYSESGAPQRLIQFPPPTRTLELTKGILPFIDPLPRWEIAQPGNILRVFERGGKRRLEVGLPDKEEEPGLPDKGLSPRGLGTLQRTDPVYLGLQKTRLLDPTLNMLGTNDHPGDYRASGCTACHVVWANDRDPVHSSFYASAGNMGMSQTGDVSIAKGESGHPIRHTLTLQIPSSQCMVCHIHPGTNMSVTYYGALWWDNESDGDKMYPEKQHNPTQKEEQIKLNYNPEASSLRGKWSDREFLDQTGTKDFNAQLKRVQFGDFHGHGWLFRYVYKRDRKGNLLDAKDSVIAANDPAKFSKAVHLQDIHLEKGMHCVDCHFRQDSHGNGNLYNEPRAAIEIGCIDCHGSIQKKAGADGGLRTSGFAAQTKVNTNGSTVFGRDLKTITTRDTRNNEIPIFEIIKKKETRKHTDRTDAQHPNGVDEELQAGDVVQNSLVEPGKWWRVVQTIDTINPDARDYNPRSSYAKTIRRDNKTWGNVPADQSKLAHADSNITCFACHSSWMTSCFGCHLSMQANRMMPNRHFEGPLSRNYTTYNYQVLRDDVFMLGIDGTTTGHRVAPVRSSSAILVSSQNQNREWIYHQQQTVSAEGYSGQAFNTHVPHTVRAAETKGCTDCHVSRANNNNAWMAQVLLEGTNFVNFFGRYIYVAADDALEAVAATEHTEPQAVYGSTLQKIAYPDDYAKFEKGGRKLDEVFDHEGNPKVLDVQLRGEYAYVAAGPGGLRVYDVAQIDQKGFSERITTAPVSPFGQRFYVKTKYATSVAAPSTLAVDPARTRDPMNQEQPIHLLYAYLYVTDKYEGLILVNAATLLDGDPLNNFLHRDLTFNPDGVLNGANSITIAGTNAYITTDKALVSLDISEPLKPKVTSQIPFKNPRAIAVQFRYGFLVDDEGMKVLDLTTSKQPRAVDGAVVPLSEARSVYVARTYAYIADGKEGIAIIDVERPEKPKLDQKFNADGAINDAHDVKVGMTNASVFAYVADGVNGLRVLQLTSPESMETYAGFSPRPQPRLIASHKTKGPALSISKGLDRDRAVDETGNQVAVFGRRGARPFNGSELERMYLLNGKLFTVTDDPPGDPRDFKVGVAEDSNEPATPDKASQERVSSGIGAFVPGVQTYKNRAGAATLGGFGVFLIVFGLHRKRLRRKKGK